MTNFTIDIVSDPVCPWCYVGHKQLSRAISQYRSSHPERASDTFSLTYHPFYLNPDAPKTGIDKTAYYAKKFGNDRTAAIFQRLTGVGESVGINFKFGGKTGNTRDAHRLVQLGKLKGGQSQTKVMEALFTSYFEHEKDITSREVLVDAAVEAGLDEKEAKSWLEGGKGGSEVDKEVQEAQLKGVSGVPHFEINGRFEVEGAQESSAFVKLFERLVTIQLGVPSKAVGEKC